MGEKKIEILHRNVVVMAVHTELEVFKVLNILGYDYITAIRSGIKVMVDGVKYDYNKVER